MIAIDVPNLDGELAISSVTLAELHVGVLVARHEEVRAERLRRLSILQRSFDPIPVDEAVTRSYGQLAAAVLRHRHHPRPRALDLLIAATAHAHGARLYTRNPDELRGLEEILDVRGI